MKRASFFLSCCVLGSVLLPVLQLSLLVKVLSGITLFSIWISGYFRNRVNSAAAANC